MADCPWVAASVRALAVMDVRVIACGCVVVSVLPICVTLVTDWPCVRVSVRATLRAIEAAWG